MWKFIRKLFIRGTPPTGAMGRYLYIDMQRFNCFAASLDCTEYTWKWWLYRDSCCADLIHMVRYVRLTGGAVLWMTFTTQQSIADMHIFNITTPVLVSVCYTQDGEYKHAYFSVGFYEFARFYYEYQQEPVLRYPHWQWRTDYEVLVRDWESKRKRLAEPVISWKQYGF